MKDNPSAAVFGRILLSLLSPLFIIGCRAAPMSLLGDRNVILGSGTVVAVNRPANGVDRVSIRDIGEVIITQDDKEALTIETDDNLMRYIKTEVRGGTLFLGLSGDVRGRSVQPSSGIRYRLNVRQVAGLEAAGAGSIRMRSLDADELEIVVSDSGGLEVDSLTVKTLRARLRGKNRICP